MTNANKLTPGVMLNDDGSVADAAGASEQEKFEAWAIREGLISESHGVRFVNSMCDTAKKAWQARALIAAGASEGQAFKEWFDENCPEFQRTSYSPADVEANAASLAKAAWHARDAELTALRERVAGMEKEAELGAYVRRLHGSLGRQTEALYDNIEHAIQEQK